MTSHFKVTCSKTTACLCFTSAGVLSTQDSMARQPSPFIIRRCRQTRNGVWWCTGILASINLHVSIALTLWLRHKRTLSESNLRFHAFPSRDRLQPNRCRIRSGLLGRQRITCRNTTTASCSRRVWQIPLTRSTTARRLG